MLYEYILTDIDTRLLSNNEDPIINYEAFTNKVADTVTAK